MTGLIRQGAILATEAGGNGGRQLNPSTHSVWASEVMSCHPSAIYKLNLLFQDRQIYRFILSSLSGIVFRQTSIGPYSHILHQSDQHPGTPGSVLRQQVLNCNNYYLLFI